MAEGNRDHLDCYRQAVAGALRGAVKRGDLVSEEGFMGLYITMIVAARDTLLGENPQEAMEQELARLNAQRISPN